MINNGDIKYKENIVS